LKTPLTLKFIHHPISEMAILALVKNAVIARAAFEQAVIQRTNRKLRGGDGLMCGRFTQAYTW
jgi:hypothetical protein